MLINSFIIIIDTSFQKKWNYNIKDKKSKKNNNENNKENLIKKIMSIQK